ncbi:winged helix-turn-helix transcriptional regulator [Streptomyces sioyaensis]|uniref:winged helix-turn-helix transcriptional regulator n=1 Tax=Streptomyces sioyaensis TaxID=67364 RepID=UPI00371A4121
MTEPKESACPINPVVDLLFSRWTTPIVWVLEHHGRLRFNELQRLVPSITPKVLTQRLRQLERDGLVIRTYHAEIPPRVEYEISELGRTLVPVFQTLAGWSDTHLPQVTAARRAYDTAREEEAAWAQD